MANAFGETLGEKARAMHFQRLVGALVTSIWNEGRFYSDKVTEARALTAKLRNDDRDEDPEGVWGFESKAPRPAVFVAEMGLRPARSWRRRKAPSMPTPPPPARPGNPMSGRTTTRRSAGTLAEPGCLRRVAKRGELAGSPSPAQRRTARTIVISRRRCDAGGDIERLVDHAGDRQRSARWEVAASDVPMRFRSIISACSQLSSRIFSDKVLLLRLGVGLCVLKSAAARPT